MAEILHHLGWLKPYKCWDNHHPWWCRISAINSSSQFHQDFLRVKFSKKPRPSGISIFVGEKRVLVKKPDDEHFEVRVYVRTLSILTHLLKKTCMKKHPNPGMILQVIPPPEKPSWQRNIHDLKMYFLLKMVTFQPAMLVFGSVAWIFCTL